MLSVCRVFCSYYSSISDDLRSVYINIIKLYISTKFLCCLFLSISKPLFFLLYILFYFSISATKKTNNLSGNVDDE